MARKLKNTLIKLSYQINLFYNAFLECDTNHEFKESQGVRRASSKESKKNISKNKANVVYWLLIQQNKRKSSYQSYYTVEWTINISAKLSRLSTFSPAVPENHKTLFVPQVFKYFLLQSALLSDKFCIPAYIKCFYPFFQRLYNLSVSKIETEKIQDSNDGGAVKLF